MFALEFVGQGKGIGEVAEQGDRDNRHDDEHVQRDSEQPQPGHSATLLGCRAACVAFVAGPPELAGNSAQGA